MTADTSLTFLFYVNLIFYLRSAKKVARRSYSFIPLFYRSQMIFGPSMLTNPLGTEAGNSLFILDLVLSNGDCQIDKVMMLNHSGKGDNADSFSTTSCNGP